VLNKYYFQIKSKNQLIPVNIKPLIFIKDLMVSIRFQKQWIEFLCYVKNPEKKKKLGSILH
jgi:hypothetical protein